MSQVLGCRWGFIMYTKIQGNGIGTRKWRQCLVVTALNERDFDHWLSSFQNFLFIHAIGPTPRA